MTMYKSWKAELTVLEKKWASAKNRWNKDGGPIEKTINAGEDLYFAAETLIEHLKEMPLDCESKCVGPILTGRTA